LLATTRAYALQQLDNNGERKAAALAYARYAKIPPALAPAVRDNRGPAAHCLM
jgi:predicted ATPase